MLSVDVKHHEKKSVTDLRRCVKVEVDVTDLRRCVKVEVDVLGSPPLIVCKVSVDVKQH